MHDASLSYARYHRLSPAKARSLRARGCAKGLRKAKTHPAVLRWNHIMKGCMEFQMPSNAMGTGTIPKSRTGLGGILALVSTSGPLLRSRFYRHVQQCFTQPPSLCVFNRHLLQRDDLTQLSSSMRC